jgi:copper oxidase (laccase) domain-containing protein
MIIRPEKEFWQSLPIEIAVSTKELGDPGRLPFSQDPFHQTARRKFNDAIGLNDKVPIITLQVCRHARRVVIKAYQSGGVHTNSLILTQSSQAAIQYTADCIPLIIYDQENHIAAFLHVGWRELLRGVVRKTLVTMRRDLGTRPENLHVYLGPSLTVDYNRKRGWRGLVLYLTFFLHGRLKLSSRRNGYVHIDVIKGVMQDLQRFGIPGSQIEVAPYCTYRDAHLFPSHAREGKSRRSSIITAIFLKDSQKD